ncbi:dihydrofolate reductase family protein [Mycolicibacterium mucogenicum]|uniref:dihydrofolate reductase family protein n=1 Tax=Mycolicibacterium mucogenicum TaxID=56689 RepID=UPI00076AA91D|nr:dihydrofolate reductase family protein [Mycolicibacterium mucogenicum]
MTQLVKVQNFNVSADGFGAGVGQSFERPFGHADPGTMFAWAGATASWPNRTDPGGTRPPFHTPVFVMTHHVRPSFTLSDTTFHFVDAAPAEVLAQAREAAQGKDIRIGGGATTVREFLDADLIDTLHIVVSPTVTLGEGSRLWESPDELLDRYHCDVVPSSSGVIHHLFWRR